MSEYHINVFWSDEDDCWVATIPDLEPCSAFGDDPESAVREVIVARDAWLATARANQQPIPEPHYRPTTASAG